MITNPSEMVVMAFFHSAQKAHPEAFTHEVEEILLSDAQKSDEVEQLKAVLRTGQSHE